MTVKRRTRDDELAETAGKALTKLLLDHNPPGVISIDLSQTMPSPGTAGSEKDEQP